VFTQVQSCALQINDSPRHTALLLCRSYKGRVVSATGTHVRMELQVPLTVMSALVPPTQMDPVSCYMPLLSASLPSHGSR